jgi:hypothetical protein
MPRPRIYTDEQMIAALQDCKGMVYIAAKRIGCEADTIYKRSRSSARVRNAMAKERGEFVDMAELKLFQAVENGEPWAITMALRCLGKDRGYFTKEQVDHGEHHPVRLEIIEEIVDAPDLPDGEPSTERSQINGQYPFDGAHPPR